MRLPTNRRGVDLLDRPVAEAASHSSDTRRAMVICPDCDELQPVTEFRRRWDPLADTVAPHLMLAFPFIDAISSTDLHHRFVQATRGIQPLRIHLADVSGSEGEHVCVNPKKGNDLLISLHDNT
jgi:hypothetical protein